MSLTTQLTGQLISCKTASFQDDKGQEVPYGKIQIMHKDASGEFYAIQNVKVRSLDFPKLIAIAKNYISKDITLNLEQNVYNGKVSFYFASVVTTSSTAA